MKQFYLLITAMLIATGSLLAQRSVTGTVTDEKGEPVIGANVVVKGTNPPVGVSSGLDGKYSIKVPKGSTTLTVSYTGMTALDVELGASDVLDVVMKDGVVLNEAVVTALGVTRDEKSLTYGLVKVGGDALTRSGEQNMIQGLAAKSSGVDVVASSGTPGGSSKILVRGPHSFSLDNQPLIILDGIPIDNSTNGAVAGDYPFNANLEGVNNSNRAIDINPDDIESVNVLKGPAASALYGSKAANGVLIITTKKGKSKKGGGLNVSFSTSVQMDMVNKLPDLQTTYGQGGNGGKWNNSTTQDSVIAAGPYSTGVNRSWGPRIGGPGSAGTPYAQSYDNLNNFFQTGMTYNNNISISGGNETATFRLSYGNTSQSGIVPNTSLARNTVSLNGKIGDENLNFTGGIIYANTADKKAQNGSNLSGVMLGLTRTPANFNLLGSGTGTGYENADGSSYSYWPIYDNPYWTAYHNPHTTGTNRITGNVAVNYKPISWLTLTGRLGGDFYHDDRTQIFDIGNNNADPTGEIWQNAKRNSIVNADLMATASHDFSDDLNTKLLVGFNYRKDFSQDLFTRGQGLTIPGYFNMANATTVYVSESKTESALNGGYFNANFGYKRMLYLDLSGRYDRSSTYKDGFFYPSVGATFIFSELMPKNDIFTYGKLRLSYAENGRAPSAYGTSTYFTRQTLTDGYTNGIGFPYIGNNGFGYSNIMGNANLKPERRQGYDIGANFKLLNNRINVDFTYYYERNYDLLLQRPIAGSTGFGYVNANIGEMVNKGIELELGVDIIKTKDLVWNLGGNLTINKNEVTALAPGVDQLSIESTFTGIGSFAIVGQPYGAFYGNGWLRDPQGRIVVDASGVPQIDPVSKYLGNPFPNWTSGIRNVLSYKGLTLNVLFDIRQGNSLWGGTIARLNNMGRTAMSADRGHSFVIPNSVQSDGNGGYVTNNTAIDANTYWRIYKGDVNPVAENAIYDGSWVRLREVSLSYRIPDVGIQFLKDVTVYVTGRNLWLSTSYPGVDPETSLTGAGSNVGGYDYFNMPNTKSIIFGLRANF